MNKWLITGVTGLLGANAFHRLGQTSRVTGTSRQRPQAIEPSAFAAADISDAVSRRDLIAKVDPDVVLHAAALSSIEACENDPALAHEVNVEASADLAAQAARAGARFIYISTDAVFDGERGGYRETDPTSPTTEYGRTKVAAERAVLAAHPGAIVARVNFYGWSPTGTRSLAEFFHRNLAAGSAVKGFTDITVSTLYIDDLVDALVALDDARASGVVHVVSSEPVTKFDFGRNLATLFRFAPELVQPALSKDVLAHARGSNISLDVTLFEELTGQALPGQRESMERLKIAFDDGVPSVVAGFANGG